jgi:poly(3-hydroxybutyrate) depolymerase
VPYGCADTVLQALRCMSPGIDRTPEQWRAPLASSSPAAKRYPPVSIWHGDVDDRVDLRNRAELVEQWTSAHGIAASAPQKPDSSNEAVAREIYVDTGGAPKVESVVVKGLAHAFPIRAGGKPSCGQPGDFVVDAKVCAARDIARFWGLIGSD